MFPFGSEIKTLLAHPQIPAQTQGLMQLMLLGPTHSGGRWSEGIREIRPAAGYVDVHGLQ